jgi:uncharacterized repeat protein (TIGR04076 family)
MDFNKKVKATIVGIEGKEKAVCSFGHTVGESFLFDQYGCDKNLCVYALETLLPAVNILLHGGKFPWKDGQQKIYWGCPHPGSMYEGLGQVIFQLEVVED